MTPLSLALAPGAMLGANRQATHHGHEESRFHLAGHGEVLRGLLARDSRQLLADYSDVIDRASDMLRDLIREIVGAGVRRGDVRSDLDLDDLAHVVSEVFLPYADQIVRGEGGLGERRVEAILETLLHGFIAKPASMGSNR